jgi:hypothetical protein
MKKILTLVSALLTMTAGAALATTVNVSSITGTWGNVTGAAATGVGTSTISWGTPAVSGGQQSSYVFDAAITPINDASSPFFIGNFTHNNYPIFAPSITGADLTVTVLGTVDDVAFSLGGVYRFTHLETPNNANPCAAGGSAPCPDLVTFQGAVGTFGDVIEVNDVLVVLGLTGFVDGFSFLTNENASNTAGLYAEFTAEPLTAPVPLPAGMWLMGTGLAAFGVWSRKSKRKAA